MARKMGSGRLAAEAIRESAGLMSFRVIRKLNAAILVRVAWCVSELRLAAEPVPDGGLGGDQGAAGPEFEGFPNWRVVAEL